MAARPRTRLALWILLQACGGPAPQAESECEDSIDNDGDGPADCRDPDCQGNPACVERSCADAADDEFDGVTDCADPDCAAADACQESARCFDGVDNDLDGAADCADADCAARERCGENNCVDAEDNDGDGDADCADPDCAAWQACVAEWSCTDGRDNDEDGLVDCEDDACANDAACIEARCDDGLDEDGDGDVDCFDADCWGSGCQTVAWAVAGAVRYTDHDLQHDSGSMDTYLGQVWTIDDVRGFIIPFPGATACAYEVDIAHIAHSRRVTASSTQTPSVCRSGFRVSEACPYAVRSMHLPGFADIGRTQAPASGDPVYVFGTWTRTMHASTATLLPAR